MYKNKIESPAVIHSERGNGFHNWFKDECRKVQDSAMKVQIVSTPFLTNKSYFDNYDNINWNHAGKKLTKML